MCGACGSTERPAEFPAEICMHLAGAPKLSTPAVFVFAQIAVCLRCGSSKFVTAEQELQQLKEGLKGRATKGFQEPMDGYPPHGQMS